MGSGASKKKSTQSSEPKNAGSQKAADNTKSIQQTEAQTALPQQAQQQQTIQQAQQQTKQVQPHQQRQQSQQMQQSQQIQQSQQVLRSQQIGSQDNYSIGYDPNASTNADNIKKSIAITNMIEQDQVRREELVRIYNEYCQDKQEETDKPKTERFHARHSSEGNLLFNRMSLDNIMERQIGKKLRQPDIAEGPKLLDADAIVGLGAIKNSLVDLISKEIKEDPLKRLGSLTGPTDYYKVAIRDKIYLQSADVLRKSTVTPEKT